MGRTGASWHPHVWRCLRYSQKFGGYSASISKKKPYAFTGASAARADGKADLCPCQFGAHPSHWHFTSVSHESYPAGVPCCRLSRALAFHKPLSH